jgi:hypothetical protein
MSKIPKFLKEALVNKKVVLFVGAGVSMSVKKRDGSPLFPSWKGFVEILEQALIEEDQPQVAAYAKAAMNLQHPLYLDAIEQAKKALGDKTWYHYVKKVFDPDEKEVDEHSLRLSRLIWGFAGNLIVTTNIDSSLRWACPSRHFLPLDGQRVEMAVSLSKDFPKTPTIWYLHGHIDDAEHIIFTRTQFEAFYSEGKNEAKLQTLLNLVADRIFLFIGFSHDDEYFRKQLEKIGEIYGHGRGSYYVLVHSSYKGKSDLPNFVEPIYFEDYGKPLEDLVREIGGVRYEFSNKRNSPTKTFRAPVGELALEEFPPPRQVNMSSVDQLSDLEIISLTKSRLLEKKQARLKELLKKNQEGTLTEPQNVELNRLEEEYDQSLLRKSEALRVAVERGLIAPLSK